MLTKKKAVNKELEVGKKQGTRHVIDCGQHRPVLLRAQKGISSFQVLPFLC